MVTAGARTLPQALVDQLAPGGKMIIPVGDAAMQELLLVQKHKNGELTKEILDYVRFVDLIGDY